jgi:uncharacterized OB-fold protein
MMVRRSHDSRDFWEGCDRHELRIMRCQACGRWIHFPRRICPNCWSDDVSAETVDGSGHVVTFSIPRVLDAAAEEIVTAVIALDAAPEVRIVGRLVECDPTAPLIGASVELTWGQYDGQEVPRFRPRRHS